MDTYTKTKNRLAMIQPARCLTVLGVLLLALLVSPAHAQSAAAKAAGPIQFDSETYRVKRFPQAIRLPGPDKKPYQEAMVIELRVLKSEFDSLPPALSPKLYIGNSEFDIHRIKRDDKKKHVTLVFHVHDWEDLADGASMTLAMPWAHKAASQQTNSHPAARRFDRQKITDTRH